MMTKEEYQKTLIRMWDSIRTNDDFMGKHDCDGVKCNNCPLACDGNMCSNYDVYEMISIVEKWGKEHPFETNGSRFLKTHPNTDACGFKDGGEILFIRLDKSKPLNADGNKIEIPAEWWNKEVEQYED